MPSPDSVPSTVMVVLVSSSAVIIRTIADYLSDAGLAGWEPTWMNGSHTMKSTKARYATSAARSAPHREGAEDRHSQHSVEVLGLRRQRCPQAGTKRFAAIGRSLVPENFTS